MSGSFETTLLYVTGVLVVLALLFLALALRLFRRSRRDVFWRRRREAGQRGWRLFLVALTLFMFSGFSCATTAIFALLAEEEEKSPVGTGVIALNGPTITPNPGQVVPPINTATVTPGVGTANGTAAPVALQTATPPPVIESPATTTTVPAMTETPSVQPSSSPTPTATITTSPTPTRTSTLPILPGNPETPVMPFLPETDVPQPGLANPSSTPTRLTNGTPTPTRTARPARTPTMMVTPSRTPRPPRTVTEPSPTPIIVMVTPTETPFPTFTPNFTPPPVIASVTPRANAQIVILELDDQISDTYLPINPHRVFNSDTTRIYLFVRYSAMTEGVLWQRNLYRDGELVDENIDLWKLGDEGETFFFFGDSNGFLPGEYEIRLFIGDRKNPINTMPFTVIDASSQ